MIFRVFYHAVSLSILACNLGFSGEEGWYQDLVIDSNGNQQMLRSENYYDTGYGVIGGTPRNDFHPCKELEGKRVQIEFLRVTGQEYSGLIKTILIER